VYSDQVLPAPRNYSRQPGDPAADPQLARAIERVAQEWRASVDATPDVIVMLAADFTILRVNRAATQFFERDFAEILGRGVAALLPELPRGADPFRFAVLRKRRERTVSEVYLRRRRIWVAATLDPILDSEGELAGAVLVLRDVTELKRTDRQLQRSLRSLQQLSAHLTRAREDERAAVAREIHDELGHALTVIKMEAAWLAHQAPTEQSWRIGLHSIATGIDEVIAAVRRIATELRPGVLDSLGVAAAIEWQAEEFQRRTGIPTRVVLPAAQLGIDREFATILFRVCQEALTNVARHAQASAATIRLRRTARRIVLEIEDNGHGFQPAARRRRTLGLLGMQERVQAAGGRLVVHSAAGQGTMVAASLPAGK
jgi:PAS domain S-box-containing protein